MNSLNPVDRSFDGATYRTAYQYDQAGLLTGIKYPEATDWVQYHYNQLNQLSEVVGFTAPQGMTYYANGSLQSLTSTEFQPVIIMTTMAGCRIITLSNQNSYTNQYGLFQDEYSNTATYDYVYGSIDTTYEVSLASVRLYSRPGEWYSTPEDIMTLAKRYTDYMASQWQRYDAHGRFSGLWNDLCVSENRILNKLGLKGLGDGWRGCIDQATTLKDHLENKDIFPNIYIDPKWRFETQAIWGGFHTVVIAKSTSAGDPWLFLDPWRAQFYPIYTKQQYYELCPFNMFDIFSFPNMGK